jgi:hypothetical protein
MTRSCRPTRRDLQAWLDENGYTATGPAIYAYYDDPFTPGMFRRNEVLFELER